MQKKELTKFEIYVGLVNKTTLREVTLEEVGALINSIFKERKIAFSIVRQLGGYAHEYGYSTENSIRVTLFDITEGEVENIAMKLKEGLVTDAVLITREVCDFYYK